MDQTDSTATNTKWVLIALAILIAVPALISAIDYHLHLKRLNDPVSIQSRVEERAGRAKEHAEKQRREKSELWMVKCSKLKRTPVSRLSAQDLEDIAVCKAVRYW